VEAGWISDRLNSIQLIISLLGIRLLNPGVLILIDSILLSPSSNSNLRMHSAKFENKPPREKHKFPVFAEREQQRTTNKTTNIIFILETVGIGYF